MSRKSHTSRPNTTHQRNQAWTRLQASGRHSAVLRPASQDPRSIFFTSSLLRANGEPC